MKVSELSGAMLTHGRVLSRAGSNPAGRAVWNVQCKCGHQYTATSKVLNRPATPCPKCRPANRHDSLLERIEKNIVMIPIAGCWVWTGKLNGHGYGVAKHGGIEQRVHRLVYFEMNPAADKKLIVCHRCDTPACCNPHHLFLGTQADNMADMRTKGRFRGGAKVGNRNAVGNQGWSKGGIVKMLGRVPESVAMRAYVASKYGEEVPDSLDIPPPKP